MNSPLTNLAIKGVVLPLLIGTLSLSACKTSGYKLAAFNCDKKNSQNAVSSCKSKKQIGGNNVEAAALIQDGDIALSHFNAGLALMMNDENARAQYEFDKALTVRINYADAHFSKGLTLIKMGQNQAALKELEIAIEINPRLSQAHYYKGLIHKELHDYSLALKNLQSAAFINPQYAAAHYAMALIHVDLQNQRAAVNSYKSAYEIWSKKLDYNPMYFIQDPTLEKAYYKTRRFLQNKGELNEEYVSLIM